MWCFLFLWIQDVRFPRAVAPVTKAAALGPLWWQDVNLWFLTRNIHERDKPGIGGDRGIH